MPNIVFSNNDPFMISLNIWKNWRKKSGSEQGSISVAVVDPEVKLFVLFFSFASLSFSRNGFVVMPEYLTEK